jgi:hypothetical protein
MATNLCVFNLQIENFFKDLLTIFPENNKLKISYEKFKLLKSVNVKKTYSLFTRHIHPLKEQIQKCDDSFFYDKLENIENTDKNISKSDLKDLFDIQDLWVNNMSDKDKKIVWDYLNVLIILSERI